MDTTTKLNADFEDRVILHTEDTPWVASPMPGVDRRMLDRIGGEVARATSVVRYAPGSKFSAHTHDGGEEFFVLEGVFQDQYGDFPAGTYVRNPPTTSHIPGSDDGCTIFVKLWQFDPDDRNQFHVPMDAGLQAHADGVACSLLHKDERETVRYWALDAAAAFGVNNIGGLELFVLEGSFDDGIDQLRKGSWLRLPDGVPLTGNAGAEGARIWMKTGHLAYAKAPAVKPAAPYNHDD